MSGCLMTFKRARRFAQFPRREQRFFIRLAEWTQAAEWSGKKRGWLSYDHGLWWLHFLDGSTPRVVKPGDVSAEELGRKSWSTCHEACLAAAVDLLPIGTGEFDDPNFDLNGGDCEPPSAAYTDSQAEGFSPYTPPSSAVSGDGKKEAAEKKKEEEKSAAGGGGGGGASAASGGSGDASGSAGGSGGSGSGVPSLGGGAGGGSGGGSVGGGGKGRGSRGGGNQAPSLTLSVTFGAPIQIPDAPGVPDRFFHLAELYAEVISADASERDLVSAHVSFANVKFNGPLKINGGKRTVGTVGVWVNVVSGAEFLVYMSVFGMGRRNQSYRSVEKIEYVGAGA